MQADDIMARLRQSHRANCKCFGCEAADEIERLRAENATLRRLLDQFVGDFKDEVQREAI